VDFFIAIIYVVIYLTVGCTILRFLEEDADLITYVVFGVFWPFVLLIMLPLMISEIIHNIYCKIFRRK